MATTKPKVSADEISKFVSMRMSENAKKAVDSAKEEMSAQELERKALADSLSTVKVEQVLKEGQKKFSDVFGYKPKTIDDIPVTCYTEEDWDDAVRGFIPERNPLYVWPKVELEEIVVGLELQDNIWVSGPTGSGKSSLIKEICASLGRPFIRFNGREDTEAASIFGSMDAKDGSTYWHDGDFTTAFKYGALVLMDEASAIPAGIQMGLQWCLEPDGKLLLTDKPGTTKDRVVERDGRFRAVYADNTRGLGDTSGAFAGTNLMNTASLDRFGTSIHLDYLSVAQEVKLLHNAFPSVDNAILKLVVKFGGLIRKSYDAGDLSLTVSPRALQNIVKKIMFHGNLAAAIKSSYINKLDEASEIDVAGRHFRTVFDKDLNS